MFSTVCLQIPECYTTKPLDWKNWRCSPELTPYDFFLWGYVHIKVFVPPLSLDIDELKFRISAAIETIDKNILERVWDELDYKLDIFWVTNGFHKEHLMSL